MGESAARTEGAWRGGRAPRAVFSLLLLLGALSLSLDTCTQHRRTCTRTLSAPVLTFPCLSRLTSSQRRARREQHERLIGSSN